MPGSGSPTRSGPNWRRRFRHPHGPRYSASARPVPIVGCDQTAPWALFQAAFGPSYGYRGYNTATIGVPAAWPGPAVTLPPGLPGSGQIVSFRPNVAQVLAGTLDSAIAAFFATVPAGAFCTAWHEAPFVGNPNPPITPSDLIALHTRLYGIFSANAPPSSSYGQIEAITCAFSGHTGFPLGQWMCTPANGGALLDFYGMDVAPQTATSTYDGDVGVAMAAMTAAGVPETGPWTICETGYHPIWAPQQQAEWYSDGWNVAQAIGAIHYLPFFSPTAPNAYQLWPAPSTDTLRVLQDAAAVARGDLRSPRAAAIARSTQAPLVASAATTSLTATFTSNPAAGSKVLVAVQSSGTASLTLTDNGTTPATFVLDVSCLNASSSIPSVWLYRADNITLPGAGTYAVTVNCSPSGKLQVAASAYTGVQNGPPSSTSANAGTGNNPVLNPVTPNDQSSLFFSAFFCDSATSPESFACSSGEFTLQQVQTGSGGFPGAVADALVTDPAPRAGGWMLPDAPDWSAVMAAYAAVPANITIVPGAEMVWAQTPVPATRVSANAGLASATGAAGAIYPGTNAGLASASGWAAVNAPSATTVNAGLAQASGSALFTPAGSTVSVTLTAINPVAATGTASPATASNAGPPAAPATAAAGNATVTVAAPAATAAATGAAGSPAVTVSPAPAAAAATGAGLQAGGQNAGLAAASGAALAPAVTDSANAGLAPATGTAQQPAVTVTVTAGLAAATGAALQPTVVTGVAPNAGVAAATGAALQPAGHTAGLASATAAALQAGGQNAGLASAAGAALNATITTGGTANAGLAAATGAAANPAVTIAPASAVAPATGAAPAAVAADAPAAGLASGSAAALQAGGQNAGLAAATGAALQPTVVTGVAPSPATAPATGTALQPAVTVTVTAGLASASGAAPQAAMANPATATGTGAALQPASHNTGAAPATGAAQAPAVTITVTAGLASASGAAVQPTVVTGVAPNAGLASATGTALQPAVTVTFTAATATATGAGLAAVHGINAGLASATGTVPAPSLTTLANAAAAQALAAALSPTTTSVAAFTVGALTASDTRTGGPS